MTGVGEQRERTGDDPDHDLYDAVRDDEPERDEQGAAVARAGPGRGRTVHMSVGVAVRGPRPRF